MRVLVNAAAAAGFCLLAALVFFGGRTVDLPGAAIETDDIDPAGLDGVGTASSAPRETDAPAEPAEDQAGRLVVAPQQDGEEAPLERIAPRPPLSDLAEAPPPKPKAVEKWKRITLFQPVAKSAGLIEAKGYSVALSGIDMLEVGESCSHQGRDWDCGTRARTALRAFLRGRAPSCVLPPEPEHQIISAECQIGNQDIAEWLVAQGWARAKADGPYAEAGKRAESEHRGMYGAPPPEPSLVGATMPAPDGSAGATTDIIAPEAADVPSVEHLGEPPAAGSGGGAADPTLQAFPPAPSQ